MHYLVSGASGFVGRVLCRQLLSEGHRVRALLRRPSDGPWQEQRHCELGAEPLPADLCTGIDGIFHLAGIAHVQDIAAVAEATYRQVNVEGTRALLAAAEAGRVRGLVYFSSVKAVADPGPRCVDEGFDAEPADAYGRSKRAAEALVLNTAAERRVCVLRPTLVYGPGVKGNLRRMLDAVAARRLPPLPETGNRRSMVGVGDLVSAAMLAMTRPAAAGRTYIVADGIDYSTRDLYLAISRALDRPVPRWTLPLGVLRTAGLAGDLLQLLLRRPVPMSSAAVQRLVGSACYRAERLRSELGWRPVDSFHSVLPAICRQRGALGP